MAQLATHFCNECWNNMMYDADNDRTYCPRWHKAWHRWSWFSTSYSDLYIDLYIIKKFCKEYNIKIDIGVVSVTMNWRGVCRTSDDVYNAANILSSISRMGKLYTDKFKSFILN